MADRIGVAVVGAGVIGLTTAVVFAEAGVGVSVLTRDLPANTTSAAAGAMWGSYLVEPRDCIQGWATDSLRTFTRLAAMPGTGVRLVPGIEASRTASALPEFLELLDDVRVCEQGDLPAGFVIGWRYTVPLIDMDVYLPYLCKRLAAAGGSLHQQPVTNLDQAARLAPIVVNATGLGARDLAGDIGLTPIRGQLVIVDNPGIAEFFTEDTGCSPDLLHLYPHGDRLILGGVAQNGSWDLEPDAVTARDIVQRCAAIDPRVADQPVRAHRVLGLRLRDTQAQRRIVTCLLSRRNATELLSLGDPATGHPLAPHGVPPDVSPLPGLLRQMSRCVQPSAGVWPGVQASPDD